MKNRSIPKTVAAPVLPSSPPPMYIDATRLRTDLIAILSQVEATKGTVIICRYNKPAAILRGDLDAGGEVVIHFIPVQSQEGKHILHATRRSA